LIAINPETRAPIRINSQDIKIDTGYFATYMVGENTLHRDASTTEK
jgi:hypothetical protein